MIPTQMESHLQSRSSAYSWTMQPDPWESKFDSASRGSSYPMKYSEMKASDYDALKPASSSYVHWNRGNNSPPTGFSWQQQPSGVMFQYPPALPHLKEESNMYRPSGDNTNGSSATTNEHLHKMHTVSEEGSYSGSLESNSSGGINRPAKRHVKSACANCKKAHLSCDESRPCHRCKQGGKISGCYDVPQRRKGRPRLANKQGAKGRDAVSKTLVVRPLSMAQDPRMTTPFSYLDFHPEMVLPVDPSNDCSTIPCAFLDVHLRLVKMNQHFKGLFSFLGDLYNQKLEHLVETMDLGLLENIRWSLRQEIESIKSQSPVRLQLLEHAEAGRLPSPDSHDTVNMYKSFVRREQLHFRFADRLSRSLTVDFSIARAGVMFVTLSFPPMRSGLGMLQGYQQNDVSNIYTFPSSFAQPYDSMRGYFARPIDRPAALPSPDSSSYFSTSPSSSSFSLSSTSSSIPPTSRHASIASHRSYEMPFSTSMSHGAPTSQVIVPAMNSPVKQISQGSTLSLPQPKGYSSVSPQLAPLQDKGQNLLNSRRLPPIPGLGSSTTSAQDTSGVDGRAHQNAWPSPDSDTTSRGEKKQEAWRNENLNGSRNRIDVKELTA